MSALFITGAGTGVGKTYVTAALIRALRAQGRAVDALKPVVSGFDPADWADSDPGQLLAALGRAPDAAALQAISPYRYKAPLSPDMAAALEGESVDYDAVATLCAGRLHAADNTLLLIEGVGGVMSPIDRTHTNLDLITAVGAPCLLVAGGYLGTISHTLTALATMRGRDAAARLVVVSETEIDGPPFGETVAAIARLAPDTPVIAAGRSDKGWSAAALAALGL